ncbi:hypothetical protein FRC11_013336, partial [Ceratobasidium sp. 423]
MEGVPIRIELEVGEIIKKNPKEHSRYAIQNIQYNKYVAIGSGGDNNAYGAEEDGAAVLELEHQFHNFYRVKVTGTKYCLEHPKVNVASSGGSIHTVMKFTDEDTLQGCLWRFERTGDDAGSPLKPRPETSIPAPPVPQPNNLLLTNSGSRYIDDAHFYTDLLFNMPRSPFNRTQRIAALDWARKLGAANVPTIESFDECERLLEAAPGSNNDSAWN